MTENPDYLPIFLRFCKQRSTHSKGGKAYDSCSTIYHSVFEPGFRSIQISLSTHDAFANERGIIAFRVLFEMHLRARPK